MLRKIGTTSKKKLHLQLQDRMLKFTSRTNINL
jgi:hypothetical protein